MKKHIVSVIAASVFLAAVSVVPSFAQAAVDAQMVDTVKAAFDNTRAVSSMSINVETMIEISGIPGMDAGFAVQQGTETYQVAQAETGWNAIGSQATTMTMPTGFGGDNSAPAAANIATEVVIVDGKTYIRFTEVPENMTEQNLPQEWADADLLAQTAGGTMMGLGALALPIDATSISALSELPADTINTQAMRVFQITLDPQAVIDSDAVSLLNADFGGGFPGGGAQVQLTPPADMPVGTPGAEFQPPSPENAQITIAVWVGADNLVHRIYSVIALASDTSGGQFSPGFTLTTVTNLSKFNEPVTITAPEVRTP